MNYLRNYWDVEMNVKTKRENWIDWCKSILIFLVILDHTNLISQQVGNFIVSFHMPAFFIISGYLHRNAKGTNVSRHFKRLIIPTLFYNLIGYLVFLFDNFTRNIDWNFHEFVTKPFIGILIYNQSIATPMCSIMWFLITMFFVRVLMDDILVRGNFIILSTFFASLLVSYLLLDFNFKGGDFLGRITISTTFYILGYFLNRERIMKIVVENFEVHKIKFWFLFFFLLTATIFLANYNGRVGIFSFVFGRNFALYYFNSLIGTSTLILLAIFLNSISNVYLLTISTGTVVIMGLHKLFLTPLILNHLSNGYFLSLIILIILYPVILVFKKYIPAAAGIK